MLRRSLFMNAPHLLEAAMLVCFGLAWPLANLRMLRTGLSQGKGLLFTLIILGGYLCGAAAKLWVAAQGVGLAPVFWLYLLNTASVALNLFLQWHYGPRRRASRVNSTNAAACVLR